MSEIQKNTQENIDTQENEINNVQQSEKIGEKVFSIVDNLGYEQIKDKLSQSGNGYSYDDVLEELGEQKASVFFYWYILYSDVDLENKKYFLSKAIDSEYNKEFVKLFSVQQCRDFAFFVVDNNLIDNFYSKLRLYLDFLDEDFFQGKYAHLFMYTESFENLYIDDIVDFVLDNMEVIHNSLQQIENSQKYKDINDFTPHKENFDLQINNLLKLNYRYFLEKLNSLEDNDFVLATQNLLVEAINNFFSLEKIDKIFNGENDRLKKQLEIFIDKLGNIGLENIKINLFQKYTDHGNYKTGNKKDNYLNILLEYKKELFEKIDIQDIMGKKTNLPNFILENKTFEEIFKNKFLEIKNINYGDLIQNPGCIVYTEYGKEQENVFLSDDVINYIADNFSEQEKIKFLIFLTTRTDLFYSFSSDENNFLQKVFTTKKIQKILNNSYFIVFISLFIDKFTSFDSIINSKQIKLLLGLGYGKLKKINTILDFFQKAENINFKIRLEDIDKEFIDFILNNFYFDTNSIRDGIFLYDIKKLNEFIDIKIDSLDFFGSNIKKENNGIINKIKNKFKKDQKIAEKEKNKGFQIQNSLGNNKLIFNLKKICKIYDIEFKLSNLIEIEKNFNTFLGNNNTVNIYLLNFLGDGYLSEIESVLKYFQKYHKKNLSLNEFLLILTKTYKIDLEYVELLDKNLSDFETKDLINIDGNKIELRALDYVNQVKKLHTDYWGFDDILKIFNGWTKESLIKFLEFFQNSNFIRGLKGISDKYNTDKFKTIYGEYDNLENYNDLLIKNKVFLIRYITQKSIDKNDFSNLEQQINSILETSFIDFKVSSYKKLGEKFDRLLKITNGYLHGRIIKRHLIQEDYANQLGLELEEVKNNFEKITGIKLEIEDFKDVDFLDILYQEGVGYIVEGREKKYDFEYFFQKFPNNNGRKWQKEDFKRGGILNNILLSIELSVTLIKRLNYNIDDLVRLYNSPIYLLFKKEYLLDLVDKILSYNKGFYYGYVKEIFKLDDKSYFEAGSKMLNSEYSDVTLENFTDFMDDGEILINFGQIENTEFKGIKPWSKEWFLDKPERKKYLEQENIGEIYYIHYCVPYHNFLNENLDIWEDFYEYYFKRIKDSKVNAKTFDNAIRIKDTGENLNKVLYYYFTKKKKSFINLLEILIFNEENFDYDLISDLRFLKNFINNEGIAKNYLKDYLEDFGITEKDKNKLFRFFEKKDLNAIENLLMDYNSKNISKLYHKKLKEVLFLRLEEQNGEIDKTKIIDSKLDNEIFIEALKMFLGTQYNKKASAELIYKYLIGNFDDISKFEQYNTSKNKEWLKEYLTEEQVKIWLSENKQEFKISEEDKKEIEKEDKNKLDAIKNYIEVSIKKIKEINKLGEFEFKTEFDKEGELISYFNKKIVKSREEIKKNDENNLFEDLKLQINSIEELKSVIGQKYAEKIVIYREQDPLKSMMMGNWVNGSCLSFYSNVKNYYSAIANSIDVNKGVYYIRNEKGILLGRVLLAIDNEKKIMRFKMYYSGRTKIDLNKYFNKYYLNLVEKMGIEKNGRQSKIEIIETDKWYPDGTVDI